MKKTILLTSIFAVSAAVAELKDVPTWNSIGVLQVNTEERPHQALMSVPFAEYGVDQNITATGLVATVGLPEGTVLYAANGEDYDSWRVNEFGQWEASNAIFVGKDGVEVKEGSTSEGKIGRGNAFWLEIPSGSDMPTVMMVGQGTPVGGYVNLSKKKWNLIGNPDVANGFDLVGKIVNVEIYKDGKGKQQKRLVDGVVEGDQICIQKTDGNLKTYRYTGTSWTQGRSKVSSIPLHQGEGCWIYPQNASNFYFKVQN